MSFMVIDKSVSSGSFNDPTPEFERVLNYYGIDSTTLFGFNKSLRYSERIIEIGETITVGGIAKWKRLSEPLEGYSYSQIATFRKYRRAKDHHHRSSFRSS